MESGDGNFGDRLHFIRVYKVPIAEDQPAIARLPGYWIAECCRWLDFSKSVFSGCC